MANELNLIQLTNAVKFAAVALAQANHRKAEAQQASYEAGEEATAASVALQRAEKALLKAARQQVSA